MKKNSAASHALIALLVLLADLASKAWAIARLTRAFGPLGQPPLPLGEQLQRFLWTEHPTHAPPVAVLDCCWHFRYVENPGAAWGFLAGTTSAWRTPFFLVISVLAMGFLLRYFSQTQASQRLLRFALALVFGGAVGNFVDRIRLGYVIDFIDWHWRQAATWPTFNVADAAISVGVGLLFLDMFVPRRTNV